MTNDNLLFSTFQSFRVKDERTKITFFFWTEAETGRLKSASTFRQEIMDKLDLDGLMSDYELTEVGRQESMPLNQFIPELGGILYILTRRTSPPTISSRWSWDSSFVVTWCGCCYVWNSQEEEEPRP